MHELSLMGSVLDAVVEQAAIDGFSRVTRIRLDVGALCSVEEASLAFCFDAIAKGTLAEGASLEIVSTPADGWCEACLQPFAVCSWVGLCPSCGGEARITGGDQIRLVELEVE